MVAADLLWTIQLEDAQVWQRERTTVTVEVQSTDRFATLEASLPRIEGVDVQALPATNEAGADSKRVLRLSWQLSAHTPGTQTFQLPAIRYNLNGRDTAQWQPPVQTLEVQALPPYLPPTIPVGQVQIESHIEPGGVLQPGHLAYWHIRLHSDAVNTAQFPPILKQMHSSGVELFPAKVAKPVSDNRQFRLDYRIPFKPKGNGKLALPVLYWHWFDPASGRLEQAQHELPRPWVLGWVWRGILGILACLIFLIAGNWLVQKGIHAYRRWHSYQQLQHCLQTGANVPTVRQAMRDCAYTHGWPANLSVRQWLAYWKNHYGNVYPLQHTLLEFEGKQFQ